MDDETKGGLTITGIVLAVILLFITVIWGVVFTDAGYCNVVTTFGKVTGVKAEGLSFKMPLIEKVHSMSIKTQLFEVKDASAASKDLQDAKTSIAINYRIEANKAGEIYRTIGKDYIEVIAHPAIQEVLKAITARWNAEDLILKRETVKEEIATELKTRLGTRGIIIEFVNITNFDFSAQFTGAIEAKAVAVQDVLRAEQRLRQIEVEARQAEQQAKGEASAAIARAEGQVKAINILSQALTPEYLRYLYIDKLAKDAKVIVVPDGMPLVLSP